MRTVRISAGRWMFLTTAVLFALAAWVGAVHADPIVSGPSPQINKEGGVIVKVTPRRWASGVEIWEFEVVFETHTVILAGDPTRFSSLVDAEGRTHSPLQWEGDPPGDHHRKGVLRFKPEPGRDGMIELRIDGVGGVPTRLFRWQLP
ncbi:MAG: hypothetical protein HY204_08750 [Nitrospirae bacterium]|nr:hypothetical protein [Nitrospirota bacterium]